MKHSIILSSILLLGLPENDIVQKAFMEENWEIIFSDERVKELCAVLSLDLKPDGKRNLKI